VIGSIILCVMFTIASVRISLPQYPPAFEYDY
jgi:hypothetical protein